MNPFEIMRRMMAKKALAEAGGTAAKPAPPSTDNDYLRKQIALNPNNKRPVDDEEEVKPDPNNKLKAGAKKK